MNKKIKLLIFCLLLSVVANFVPTIQCYAQTDFVQPTCSAKSMILMEKNSGRILAEKNSQQQLSIASTTKIVTCITVIENCQDLNQKVKIDKRCVGIEGTSIYLREGEIFTIQDLLYGLMLRSGNDAAVALAYAIGGSIENFCTLMNATAKKYGANECNFMNPHGLDVEGHHCSAKDLANITRHALNNPVFAKIVSTTIYNVEKNEVTNPRNFKNKNKLLYRYDGANGVKTGFTKKAGRCLVSSCERDGMTLVCVVLNCGPMFEESEALFDFGFKNYSYKEILSPYFICGNLKVINGVKESVDIYSVNGFSYPVTEQEYFKIKTEFDYPEDLHAPFSKEKIIGTIKIYLDNNLLFEDNIYTIESVDAINDRSAIEEIIKNW